MRRFLAIVSVIGALVSWALLLNWLDELRSSGPHSSLGLLVVVALEAIAWPIAAVTLFRDLRANRPGAAPRAEPSDSSDATVMSHTRAQRRRFRWIVATPFILMGGCGVWGAYDVMRATREAGEFNRCIANHRRLDEAIRDFTKEKNRPPQSLQEVVDSKLGSTMPACPVGGSYSLTKGEDGGLISTCSVHGSENHLIIPKHPFL